MSNLDDVMQEHIAYIVLVEKRPFCYYDFLRFNVDGKEYHMTHGTFRNKASELVKSGKIELEYCSGPAFYTLKGHHFGKPMTQHISGISGGPLLNMQGQVIGMNTAILSRNGGNYSSIVFAIPSDTIAKEVPFLIRTGTYVHPWLGFSDIKITPDIANNIGVPAGYKGVIVDSVQQGSPAEKVGLRGLSQNAGNMTQIGDIIVAVDGQPGKQFEDIINYIESQKNVGDNIKLTVNRDGQIMDLTATLGAMPQTNRSTSSQNQQTQPPGLGPISEFPQLPPLLP